MYAFAVVLIIFEGIIIQCKGNPNGTSLESIPNAPVNENIPFLPENIVKIMMKDTKFATINVNPFNVSDIINMKEVINEIFKDRIVRIALHMLFGKPDEYYRDGDIFVEFGNYNNHEIFFNIFGDQVKKLTIDYTAKNDVLRQKINKNIISKCAKHLEVLKIVNCDNNEVLWQELSSEGNDIVFPKVKKFEYSGEDWRNPHELNLIFPELESVKIARGRVDENCLANVKNLKELGLNADYMHKRRLISIFEKNKELTRISLTEPIQSHILELIAEKFTYLKTLNVEFASRQFLFQKSDRKSLILPKVTHFSIKVKRTKDIIGKLSFDMPNLERLSLKVTAAKSYDHGGSNDQANNNNNRIMNFVKQFEKLRSIDLILPELSSFECIKELRNIEELTINYFELDQIYFLRDVFRIIDENYNLQKLKVLDEDAHDYRAFEDTIKHINDNLRNSEKPTWAPLYGDQIGTKQTYMLFERQP